jgi:two-component system LytT family response regulator
MIRCIIVDDEPGGRQLLEQLLLPYNKEIEVVATCANVDEALIVIASKKPELVFLDIEMPGSNGFSLLERIEKRDFEVIFVTAHNEYAIKAFKHSAFDYLLKPIDSQELRQTIARVMDKLLPKKTLEQKINFLLETIKKPYNTSDRIAVQSMDGFRVVKHSDIVRLESDSNYSNIYLLGGTKITVSKTLKDFEELLSDHGFIRVHQSHLVNTIHIIRYVKGEGGIVYMVDGSQVDISRRSKAQFLTFWEGI